MKITTSEYQLEFARLIDAYGYSLISKFHQGIRPIPIPLPLNGHCYSIESTLKNEIFRARLRYEFIFDHNTELGRKIVFKS
jgi:hypothetical protein